MRQFELKENASNYLDDVLSFDNTLCSFLKIKLGNYNKKFTTMLPESANSMGINNYSSGGILTSTEVVTSNENTSSKLNDTTHWLAKYLQKKILEDGVACIFDDVMASPSDLNAFSNSAFFINQDILHIVTNKNLGDEESLKKLIYATKVSWHFVCLVAKLKEETENILKLEFENDIESLCEVIVGAYDGEAFIVTKLS